MNEIDVLESVLTKVERLVEGVRPDQLGNPTPCPEYDVATLVDHIAAWLQVFESAANGGTYDGDPAAYVSASPADDIRTSAKSLVAGWREGGTDREVRLTGPKPVPAEMALGMTFIEYVTHGTDLARGTGQPVPFDEAEIEAAYGYARTFLPPDPALRGDAFGPPVDVPEDAPVLDRFLGHMGRRPAA